MSEGVDLHEVREMSAVCFERPERARHSAPFVVLLPSAVLLPQAHCTTFMSSQYPQNFLHRPTTAEYDELARLSAEAEANRLEGGDQLVWNGEQLEAGVLPPEIYPHDEFSSPAPLRALHSKLVDPHSRPSARPWTLTLVEALQSGSDQWSQVWRGRASCAVARRDSESWPVVLKLYHQALFPPPLMHESNPEHDSWNWHSAAYRQEREALVYR